MSTAEQIVARLIEDGPANLLFIGPIWVCNVLDTENPFPSYNVRSATPPSERPSEYDRHLTNEDVQWADIIFEVSPVSFSELRRSTYIDQNALAKKKVICLGIDFFSAKPDGAHPRNEEPFIKSLKQRIAHYGIRA